MKHVFPKFFSPTRPWALFEFVESLFEESDGPLLLGSHAEELNALLLLKASWVELRDRLE